MQAAQNYIYIVFVVLYMIYSVIKVGKKAAKQKPVVKDNNPRPGSSSQPQSAQTNIPPQKKEGDFKTILEDMFGGMPNVGKDVPTPVQSSSKKIPEKQITKSRSQSIFSKPNPIKKTTNASQRKEKTSSVKTEILPTKPRPGSEPAFFILPAANTPPVLSEREVVEETDFEFDFRQAVIYSEILKRPNW